MTHLRLTRSRTACVAVLLAVLLCCTGCGRRGRLELPPEDAPAAAAPTGTDQAKPPRPKKTRQVPPPKDFILDPLI